MIAASDPNRQGRLHIAAESIPEAFRERVAAEIAAADARARELVVETHFADWPAHVAGWLEGAG